MAPVKRRGSALVAQALLLRELLSALVLAGGQEADLNDSAADNETEGCRAHYLCDIVPPDVAPQRIAFTVAGVLGASGHTGDGGAADRARLRQPTGIVIDPAMRHLFVADTGNHAVRLVDLETGFASTIAGMLRAPGAGPEMLQAPRGAALLVDPAPESGEAARRRFLLVADTENHAVRAVDLEFGTISVVAGVPPHAGRTGDAGAATSAHLVAPRGIAVSHRRPPATAAAVALAAGGGGEGSTSGAVAYIADSGNHAIRVLDLEAGTLTTLAGTLGFGGLAGDGGLAAQAMLHFPYCVEIDDLEDRLYITEPYNHAVRVIDLTSGVLSTLAGKLGLPGSGDDGQPSTEFGLNFPYGLSLDSPSRQLFVADANNHAIRLIDLATGTTRTAAGRPGAPGRGGTPGPADEVQFDYPTGVAVDPAPRRLYVSDRRSHAVRVVDLGVRALATVVGSLGNQGYEDGNATEARLFSPRAVALHLALGEAYVADASNNAVRRIDLRSESREVDTAIGNGTAADVGVDLVLPAGLAIANPAGDLDPSLPPPPPAVVYVADAGAHVVYGVDMASGTSWIAAGAPTPLGAPPAGDLHTPYGLAIDSAGERLFIADSGHHVVRILVVSTGVLDVIAGSPGLAGASGDGGPAVEARLRWPRDLALLESPLDGGAARLFVADTENHAVRSVDLDTGIITTVAGTLGMSSADALAVATPPIAALGASALAGRNGLGFEGGAFGGASARGGRGGDGNLGTEAQLQFPFGLAVDSAARQLFIADNWNHAIRLLDLRSGLLTTIAGVLGAHGSAGDGGRADAALLRFPQGLAMDAEARRLYVADAGNHALRVVGLTDDVRSDWPRFGLV